MPRRGERPDPVAATFGAAVRAARQERGETLEDLAARIRGLDPRYLGEIELGWHAPTITRANQIADALEISLSTLVRDL